MKKLILLLILLFFSIQCKGYVIDSISNKVEEKNYQRIISLAPSITETLKFLGLESRIVGITRYCNIKGKEEVGGLYDLKIEKIIYLKPDLVLMLKTGNIENYEILKSKNINVFVLDYRTVEDIFINLEKISKLTKTIEENRKSIYKLKEDYNNTVKKAKEILKGKRVFVMYSYPLIYTASSNSYVAQIIRETGCINLSDKLPSKYQSLTVNLETVLSFSPDIVIITENNYESITNELTKLGLKSSFVYINPLEISPIPTFYKFIDKVANLITSN
ncbi:MAG: ABC transporter substrate-binding protein [Brevinematia bacterium]